MATLTTKVDKKYKLAYVLKGKEPEIFDDKHHLLHSLGNMYSDYYK